LFIKTSIIINALIKVNRVQDKIDYFDLSLDY